MTMAITQTTPVNETAPPLPDAALETITVEQEKINPGLNDYITALGDKPFTQDLVTAPSRVVYDLARFWPKLQGRAQQARELWGRIATIVQSIPTEQVGSTVALRIVVASSQLAPGALPAPKQAAVLATFDTVDGILRRYVVPAANEAPLLEDMAIPAGLMVLVQSVPPLTSVFEDNRPIYFIAGNTTLFGPRNRDPVLSGDAAAAAAGAVASPSPNLVPPGPHAPGTQEQSKAVEREQTQAYEQSRLSKEPFEEAAEVRGQRHWWAVPRAKHARWKRKTRLEEKKSCAEQKKWKRAAENKNAAKSNKSNPRKEKACPLRRWPK